jgi:tetratricopeptide (TPR) repeat protein
MCLLLTATRAATDDQRATSLTDALVAPDPISSTGALNTIHALLQSKPEQASHLYGKYWVPALIASAHYQEANQLALDSILAAPWQSGVVEDLQTLRVQALLSMGQYQQSLANAKSLFNVASLSGTEHALLLVAQSIKLAHPGDIMLLSRFIHEQIAGESLTTNPAAAAGGSILSQITIDPTDYQPGVNHFSGDDNQSRRAQGNLLLLAGRSDEALNIFQALAKSSSDETRQTLAFNIARAIKACDGTIGRANQFMRTHGEK